MAVKGSMWLLQSLHGCYGSRFYFFLSKITVRGSNATGPSRGSYGIYVAVRVFVIVTGLGSALFLLQKSPCVALTGQGHLVAVMGSTWLLQSLCGCYWSRFCFLLKNLLAWL